MPKETSPLIELNTELKINSPYYFGSGILNQLINKLNEYNFDKLFLISDSKVHNLYGKNLLKQLKSGFPCGSIILPEGEIHKNIKTLNDLCESLIKKDVTKDSILLALGGGVIGNVVGLAAALIYRGIRFVEIPTTILSQTDSTLSNKQAVNSNRGKNLFGVYYAPLFIWADAKVLLTEEPRGIKGGLVESVKNGLIADPQFLVYLDRKLNKDALFPKEVLQELVYKSILSKIDIIKKDPSEKKYGVILEYGHTFGHALEMSSHASLTHGEAIAIGIAMAAELSHKLGYLNAEGVERHYYFLKEKLGMDLKIPPHIKIKEILDLIKSDNKRSSKGVKYILLEDIGKILNPEGDYMVKVEDGAVVDVLKNFIIN